MSEGHPCWTGNDRRYQDLGPLLPTGESLKQCKERILPYWHETICPAVRSGRRVLVAAHNNVIRCLCKHIDGIHRDHLRDFEVPTGAPLVYTLDRTTLEPVGERSEIGFSGTFLTPENSKELLQREIAAKKQQQQELERQQQQSGFWFMQEVWGDSSKGGEPGPEQWQAAEEQAAKVTATMTTMKTTTTTGEQQQPWEDTESDGITEHARLDEVLLENSEQMLEQVGATTKMGPIKVQEVFVAEQLMREAERLGIDKNSMQKRWR